jgi:hypothetical protein
MKYNIINAKINDVIQIYSDEWYVFNGHCWEKMSVKEQLELSLEQ